MRGSLAAESTNQLGAAHTATALLLAAEAERLDDTPMAGALLASLTAEPSLQHDLATGADGVSNAAFSSNGRIVEAQTTDNRVVFWSLPSGHRMPIQVNVKDATGLGPMQFLDHDNLFAVQRYGKNFHQHLVYSVEVRSMRTGAVTRRIDMSDGWTSSANAPFIADSDGKIIRVFNADTSQIVRTLPSSGGNQPAGRAEPERNHPRCRARRSSGRKSDLRGSDRRVGRGERNMGLGVPH